MKFTESHFPLTKKHLDHEKPKRSGGIHVTDIIKKIALSSGILLPQEEEELDWERMALGCAWEEWIVKHHPDIIHQPGEIVVDGIAMTPDGISLTSAGPEVHEIKVTWESARKKPGDSGLWWMRLAQGKAYCRGVDRLRLDKVKCRVVNYHVYHVNGEYNFLRNIQDKEKRNRVYTVTFSDKEVESNWTMMLNGKKEISR